MRKTTSMLFADRAHAIINTLIIWGLYIVSCGLHFLLRLTLRILLGRPKRDDVARLFGMLQDSGHLIKLLSSLIDNEKLLPFRTPEGYFFLTIDLVPGIVLMMIEPYTRRLLRLNRGEVFVDVGANIGLYTVKLARMGAHVIAIEPIKTHYAILELNVRFNGVQGQVKLFNVACWEKDGTLTMSVPATLVAPQASAVINVSHRYLHVKCCRLDRLLTELDVVPSLIKIDAEGAEPEILRGAQEVIYKHRPKILVEVHNVRANQTYNIIKAIAEDANYRLFKIKRFIYARSGDTFHILMMPR